MRFDFETLSTVLAQYTGPKRLQHSLNVAQAAVALAEVHAPSFSNLASIAGLLHDNAKKMEDKDLIKAVRHFDIPTTAIELAMPSLLHGKVGAALLPDRFGVEDPDIAQAVADHVTGRPGMGVLSRILFVADQAAADRDFPGVDRLRKLMHVDLQRAVFLVARNKLLGVVHRGWLVQESTMALYNELVMEGWAVEP